MQQKGTVVALLSLLFAGMGKQQNGKVGVRFQFLTSHTCLEPTSTRGEVPSNIPSLSCTLPGYLHAGIYAKIDAGVARVECRSAAAFAQLPRHGMGRWEGCNRERSYLSCFCKKKKMTTHLVFLHKHHPPLFYLPSQNRGTSPPPLSHTNLHPTHHPLLPFLGEVPRLPNALWFSSLLLFPALPLCPSAKH